MTGQNREDNQLISRSFRDLSDEEIKDPEKLTMLAAMGWRNTFDWQKLLESERVLLFAEAGAGKTHECQELVKQLTVNGEYAFFFALEAIANDSLDDLMEPEDRKRFRAWRMDGASTATFFLDSVDELKLSQGDFRKALRRVAKEVDGHLWRCKFVVTSRPLPSEAAAFLSELPLSDQNPDSAELIEPRAKFRALISGEARKEKDEAAKEDRLGKGEKRFRQVALMPMSHEQIEAFIVARNVNDSEALLTEIENKRSWDLARRPQELIEICAYWREHKKLGSRSEQMAQNIHNRITDTGGRKKHFTLAEQKALEGATRLALALALTRKKTIRFSDLSVDGLEAEAALDPAVILSDWNDNERQELLQRPLFGFASYGRVRFRHRSEYEYLAAQRLALLHTKGNMPKRRLHRLFFAERYDEKVVVPSLRAVASWLALDVGSIRVELLNREPEALMDEGDPESFSIENRNKILAAFCDRYKLGGWRGIRIPFDQIRRFASAELSPTIRKLWGEDIENPEVKELIIDLIFTARMADCLDIAESLANSPKVYVRDRNTAIAALAEMKAPRELNEFTKSLLNPADNWPSDIKWGSAEHLYPKHLTEEQFCLLLSQVEVSDREISGIRWHLPHLVRALKIDAAKLSRLRDELAKLIKSAARSTKNWPRYKSDFDHLALGLAALCNRELKATAHPSAALVEAAVLASRFCERDNYGDDKPLDELRKVIQNAKPTVRQQVYLTESAFCKTYVGKEKSREHAVSTTYDSLIPSLSDADFPWLLDILGDLSRPRFDREADIYNLWPLCRSDGAYNERLVSQVYAAISDSTELTAEFAALLKPPKRDKKWEAQEAKWKRETLRRKAKEAQNIADWVAWRDKVVAKPKGFFADKSLSGTIWNLWFALDKEERSSTERTGWRKEVIADTFSPEVADLAEEAFKKFWRTQEIPLSSEREEDERNSYYYSWFQGLVGLYAEAGADPDWAEKLSKEEAELAARYAPIELNSFPSWLGDLAKSQPEIVDRVLGVELSNQLERAVKFHFPDLIADISRADESVQQLLAPRIWNWLRDGDHGFADDIERSRMHQHIERAIRVTLARNTNDQNSELAELVKTRLKSGLSKPFALLWAILLLHLEPSAAIDVLEKGLKRLGKKGRYAFSQSLFAAIGERRGVEFAPNLNEDRFEASLLLSLVRLAYSEIKREEDIDRVGGGTYSPTARDDAQRGRDVVLGALLDKQGTEAWEAKLTMRSDPLFAHFKDRLAQIAKEGAASEADGEAIRDSDLRTIDEYGEAPPSDRDGMFTLMMDRLEDLRHDIDHHEFSDKATLARIDQEVEMQNYLAKRLLEQAKGAYTIDREAHVVDAKETDIRLRSVRSQQQAAIEIKLGDNRPVNNLLEGLSDQLVGQYMRHDNCKAGCLLVTLAKKRKWDHPDTGKKLSFGEVIELLKARAEQIQCDMTHSIRLDVFGLDFTA